MTWEIIFTHRARLMLAEIKDRRVRNKIVERIDSLSVEPEKSGYPLRDKLAGYRSIRAVGQRYRIIYTTAQRRQIVAIIAIGIRKEGDRKDIYALAERIAEIELAEGSLHKTS